MKIKKPIILGIEGTAWNFSAALVNPDDVLVEVTETYSPKNGGIHPREAGQHHATYAADVVHRIFQKSKELGIDKNDIDGVAFSQGPGLGPCLRIVATTARMISLLLKKPLIGVNHCIAHIEVGIWKTPAKDPIVLYVSGANSQVLGYKDGKYRVFGETLDIGLGNALDKFSRTAYMAHPGGPKIEAFAKSAKKYIELPYTVKGMDFFFSGLSSAATRALEDEKTGKVTNPPDSRKLADVCYSYQETAFAMAVEVTERALAHTGKNEVLLAGGVGANMRLREMLETMCSQRGAEFYVPEKKFMGDNGAMIAYTGLLMFLANDTLSIEESHIRAGFRPDQVNVSWREKKTYDINDEIRKTQNGAEAVISVKSNEKRKYVLKERVSKIYRIREIDEKLRKERTHNEARMMSEARRIGIPTPVIYDITDFTIKMQYIEGIPVKYVIDSEKAEIMGHLVGKMHQHNIIHGDLTTSNMIWSNNGKMYVIDFGLAYTDKQTESKGVDIHVLFQTFESTHKNYENLTESFKRGYIAEYDDAENTIKRSEEIKNRGRYI